MKEEIASLEASLASESEASLRSRLGDERAKAERRKGIDICFLVDCTGSMGSWIK